MKPIGLLRKLRSHAGRTAFGLFITLIVVLAQAGWLPPMQRLLDALDTKIYDLKVQWSLQEEVDETVVILDIDERSLGRLGQWPWNRALMAQLNDVLFDHYGLQVLGYDIVWAEPDAINRESLRRWLGARSIAGAQLPDELFARAMAQRNVVLGYYFSNQLDSQPVNVLPPPALGLPQLDPAVTDVGVWRAYTGNLPELQRSASAAGFFNPLVDPDGVIRRVPLLARYGDAYYESLSLALLRQALGGAELAPGVVEQGSYRALETLTVGPLTLPVARDGAVFVPYIGKERSFRYVSLVDILEKKAPKEWLEGKIGIMGSSAPGLRDQRATPFQSVYSGVEVHANLVSGMLNERIRQAPDFSRGLVMLQLLAFGVVLSLLMPLATAVTSGVLLVLTLAATAGLNLYLWEQQLWVVPYAALLVLLIAIFVLNVVAGYFVEGRAQRQIVGLFGQYVPKELVSVMAENPGAYTMDSKDAELSIMFTDIRGFTSISEAMSARQLSEFMNEYFNIMTEAVMSERGTVDKYIGDAVMAFWGAPIDEPRHAHLAVRAGLKMQKAAHALSDALVERGFPPFRMGLGIHTGLVRVGDMGSDLRRTYTALGDPVNLASRLEGLTKYYHCDVLVSEAVVAQAPAYLYRLIDRVRVKGKDQAVAIYIPLCEVAEAAPALQQLVAQWNEALDLFQAQQWTAFLQHLQQIEPLLLSQWPDDAMLQEYRRRAQRYLLNPPPQPWDGVVSFDEK